MKIFLVSILLTLSILPSFSQNTPICATETKKYVNEIGLAFPLNAADVKDYVNANNVVINPLTSGFSSGFQLGKHRIINDQATLGIILGSNAFVSTGTLKNQIYQLNAHLTGRLYFGESWRNGVFTEIGVGPEAAASSIQDGAVEFQINLGSRFGVGYNYQFNKDVTLGLSLIASPSVMSDNYFNNAKVVVNMLW